MTQTTIALDEVSTSSTALSPRLTIAWALKRTLLGISILIVGIGGMAWLMHTAIDQNAEAKAAASTAPTLPATSQPIAAR